MSDQVKYPRVWVRMIGEDGNAFAVLGRVRKALKRAEVPQDQIEAFVREATAADYDHLLGVVQRWVNIT